MYPSPINIQTSVSWRRHIKIFWINQKNVKILLYISSYLYFELIFFEIYELLVKVSLVIVI